MLTAILVLLVLGLALAVLLWAGTALIQGNMYTEAPADLYWRAPAAALAVSLFVAFWCLLAHRFPGTIGPLFAFGAQSDERFTSLIWVRPDPADEERFIEVRRYTYSPGKKKYLDTAGRPWSRSSSDSIIEWMQAERKEGDNTISVLFKADLKDGAFKDPATYIEQGGKGRVMTEEDLGRVAAPRSGFVVIVNLLLHAAFFGIWFVCLWLLLQYQWLHALGLALPLWAALILTVVPMLLAKSTG